MGFRVSTNTPSLNAQRNLGISQKLLASALEKLSSGSRINRASDDPAGLSISEGLISSIRGYTVAVRNTNDAAGFLQTADGALANLTNIAQRLREIAVQAATGTLGVNDRTYLDTERNQLVQEFDRVAAQTNFNGTNLLDGSFTTTNIQVGSSALEVISFSIGNARASNLGSLATQSGLQNQLTGQVSALTVTGTASAGITAPLTTDDTVSYKNNSFSAIAIAREINNKAGTTAVFADVKSTVQTFSTFNISSFGGALTGSQFSINGINITGTATTTNSFVDLVNSFAAQSGVNARLSVNSTTSVDLYATDGRNITLIFSTASVNTTQSASLYIAFDALAQVTTVSAQMLAGAGLSASLSAGATITATGTINLRSSSAITINSGVNASNALGFTNTSISVNTAAALNSIDVKTQTDASSALPVIDATLTQLNNLRASLGATQSRIDSTSTNLAITVQNLSAAKSNIRDTDIAAETANLTKAQILMQAGVSVLGQANQASEAALKLLNF